MTTVRVPVFRPERLNLTVPVPTVESGRSSPTRQIIAAELTGKDVDDGSRWVPSPQDLHVMIGDYRAEANVPEFAK
jgi:hypothetical protein